MNEQRGGKPDSSRHSAGQSGARPRLPGESSGRLKRSNLEPPPRDTRASTRGDPARDTKGAGERDGDAQRLVGRTLGPCKILELIGEGGLGRVYRARHLRLEHDVAVKVVGGTRTKPEALARFKREATIAARLNHPHVARVLDTNEQDGIHYIIQELVAGTSLEERVGKTGALSIDEVLAVGLGLASGLESIHKAGVVHRDLKPANVIIAPDGQPKLLDFGIAKDLEGEVGFTDEKAMLGTPTFLAPEQVSGQEKVGPPADLYGLGGTLYFALSARAPLEPRDDDTLLRYLNRRTKETPPDVRSYRKDAPPALASLVAKLLAIEPDDRPTAGEAYDVLKSIDRAAPARPRSGPPAGGAPSDAGRTGPSSGRHRAPDPKKGSSDRFPRESRQSSSSGRLGSTPQPVRTGGIQGSLEDMSLMELLQGVEFNAKTGHVEVEGDGVSGVIEFQEGSPWDARTVDGAQGEAAIRKLLAISSGSFALRSEAPREGVRKVKVSFTRLLLDQSRVSDESGRHEAIPDPGPSPGAVQDDDPDTSELAVPKKLHSTDEVRSALAALEAMALPDPVGDPFLGCTVGTFEVERLVGLHRGERRYLAMDTGAEARCLLRVFPLFGAHEVEFRALAKRADAALKVEHPTLDRCVGSGRTRDAYYAAFEPAIGRTLATVVQKEGPQDPDRVLDVVERVALALKALHRRNHAHGGVSADTVRLEPGGGVVLCEAGLSRPHPAFSFLGEGELLGAPGFAAPEALDLGIVGPGPDLYALGCVAWTLLSGAPPADADEDPLKLLERAHAPLPPPRLPRGRSLPEGLRTLLEKLTAVDPRQRYANVNDLLADLRAVRQGERVRAFPAPPEFGRARSGFLASRPQLMATFFGGLALALIVALAIVVSMTREISLDDPLEGYTFTLDGK
jgi:serine/threonine protein kinase